MLCGLSTNSVYLFMVHQNKEKEEEYIEDPEQAERIADKAWG